MYFKSDAQRKAVFSRLALENPLHQRCDGMTNVFSRGSPFSVSALSAKQIKGCNKFSDDDGDYSGEENQKVAELSVPVGSFRDIKPSSDLTLQEMNIEMHYPRASADEIEAIQSAAKDAAEVAKIEQQGLSALAHAPSYLYDPEIRESVSGYLGPYIAEQAQEVKTDAAREMMMPVYDYRMNFYKKQPEDAAARAVAAAAEAVAASAKEGAEKRRRAMFDEPNLRKAYADAESKEGFNEFVGSLTPEERKEFYLNTIRSRANRSFEPEIRVYRK